MLLPFVPPFYLFTCYQFVPICSVTICSVAVCSTFLSVYLKTPVHLLPNVHLLPPVHLFPLVQDMLSLPFDISSLPDTFCLLPPVYKLLPVHMTSSVHLIPSAFCSPDTTCSPILSVHLFYLFTFYNVFTSFHLAICCLLFNFATCYHQLPFTTCSPDAACSPGLFDVHTPGVTPYSCGSINPHQGLQLLEAFNFAVDYVNQKSGLFTSKLRGVRLGAIGLDVCQNPTRAGNLVANIHNGNVRLSRSGGLEISPQQIMAYVGPFDTDSTIRVADILSAIGVPQVTYGATGLQLQDPIRYPYLLRSVPADDKQARAIISYLKNFNMTNIQVNIKARRLLKLSFSSPSGSHCSNEICACCTIFPCWPKS